ncbi:hypothetical protein GCM10022415_18240 [Knoellia locipacati]|uniref:Uncharacterized protein n=1 Tax=Knoellia locipacati TaxID=882824 RepID=A0A512T0M3_9MICO|nr:PGPGW domain-containing protein [Knoellia locipacati]GEQ13772.1 hypothetical protein KLO01_18190 [Knoellia locipacati]
MIRLLVVGGAVMALVGAVLIPLPGPGYPLVVVGVIALATGVVLRTRPKQGT